MLEEELSCLGKAQQYLKDGYLLVRAWQLKKNCKYLKAHHVLQWVLWLDSGSVSMPEK